MAAARSPATPSRLPRNKGLLGWVERKIIYWQDNPEAAGRAFRVAYWISVAFILIGYAVILLTVLKTDPPNAPYVAVGLGAALLVWLVYAVMARRRRGPQGP